MTQSEEISEKLKDLTISAYDKGVNDAIDTVITAFMELKKIGFTPIPIDTVIEMVKICKESANESKTTFGHEQ